MKINIQTNIKFCFIKASIFLFLFALCLTTAANTSPDYNQNTFTHDRVIITRGPDDYPPYIFTNEKGEPDGFCIELFKTVMNKLNLQYQISLGHLDSICDMAESEPDKVDVVLGSLHTNIRTKFLDFCVPYSDIAFSIVSLKDNNYKTLSELDNKKVIILGKSQTYDVLSALHSTKEVIIANTIFEGLDMLANKEGDAMLMNAIPMFYYIDKNKVDDIFSSHSAELEPTLFSMAVTQQNKDLLYKLNKALYELKADGTYDKIYDKWITPYEQHHLSKNVRLLLLASEIIFVLLLIFIFILRLRVNKVTKKLKQKNSEISIIVEKLKKENELKSKIEKQLRQEELKFRTIVNSTNEAILIHDAKTGTVIDCNTSTLQMYGYERKEDFLKGNIHLLSNTNSEAKDKIEEVIKKGAIRFEWLAVRKDKSTFWTEISMHCCEINEKTSIVAVVRNIDESKKIKDQIIADKEKAEKNNLMKSVFLANMSHEIRTPLNAIVGFSNMLESAESEADRKNFKSIILKNSDLLLQLINDILDMSKIESGEFLMQMSKFTVSSICEQVLSTIEFKIDKTIISLCNEANFNCIVESDRNRISQVIINFLTNAIKFTPSGSITLRTEKVENNKVEISVIDTGIGIPKDKIDSIFDRFLRLNTFVQGSGLGLSICQIIMQQLGGEIGVESEAGIGSRFWIRLPYIQETAETENITPPTITEKQPSIKEKLTTPTKRCKILAAEDDDNNYQLLYFILKNKFELFRAVNGKEAVDMFPNIKPDIVLMDLKMPVMDGYEATRLLRQLSPQIPIIAITAYAYDNDLKKAIQAGCNDYITKPITIDILMEKLMKCD